MYNGLPKKDSNWPNVVKNSLKLNHLTLTALFTLTGLGGITSYGSLGSKGKSKEIEETDKILENQ